jgi:hypothetical protein
LLLIILIIVVGVAGGAFIYWNERRLRGVPARKPARPAVEARIPIVEGYSQEVTALLPMLVKLNPVGLHSLKKLLADPEQANELLHGLSHLDPDLVKRIRNLDRDSRALLMALAGD